MARIEDVHLWWPAGYGAQDLYCAQAELLRDGQVIDTWEKRIGFQEDHHAGNAGFSDQW